MAESADELDLDEEDLNISMERKELELVPALVEPRHIEPIEAGFKDPNWRMKDRMKTVSVALVLCLNLPVDPPDVVKLKPCARLEAWIDPKTLNVERAVEAIGANLQKAYERGQPKARYKISKDPTVEDIKKLLLPLRRNAKEERLLFHYNGHGVPRPTDNGEIWVFNSNYTQYIPLSIYDLQQWMGTPAVYVYDCSHSGKIINHFRTICAPDNEESRIFKYIHLGACREDELLPQNSELPADLFTSCLTTPVKIAIRYYYLQNKNKLIPSITFEMLDRIPGQLNDRRSMLGELNWIFTAITDTIAWNSLPRKLFQKLFRQDLLVASLFRNFLLAQRIMRSYDCTPVSCPEIPETHQHHMWDAWDLALETSLAQLPKMIKQHESAPGFVRSIKQPEQMTGYVPSNFFELQLTAFQIWLKLGSAKREPPEQLPIVLQVLLSQVYRPRALELLGSFLGLGTWAVNLVLDVGIFPYILKLLQSTAKELRPLLTLLWAKILAVDPSCRADLVKENGHKYFTHILRDGSVRSEIRTMACFIMTSLVSESGAGQISALQCNILPLCLELLTDHHAPLRQWAALCVGRTWNTLPIARWEATRDNGHEKIADLLSDNVPEIRAAAVYALGTFIQALSKGDTSAQGKSINYNVALTLLDRLDYDASPLVKRELVVALPYLLFTYESVCTNIAKEEQDAMPVYIPRALRTQAVDSSKSAFSNVQNDSSPMNKRSSGLTSRSHGRLELRIWNTMLYLKRDPHTLVSKMAEEVVGYFHSQARPAPSNPKFPSGQFKLLSTSQTLTVPISKAPTASEIATTSIEFVAPRVKTHFVEWCSSAFIRSVESVIKPPVPDVVTPTTRPPKIDPVQLLSTYKFEEQLFGYRVSRTPTALMFHPTEPLIMMSDKRRVHVYDYGKGIKRMCFDNNNYGPNQITSLTMINPYTPAQYICTGCDDGSIKIWSQWQGLNDQDKMFSVSYDKLSECISMDSETNYNAQLITSFQALEDVGPSKRGTGLLMSWEQTERTLAVAGDSKVIRLWDLTSELFSKEIITGSQCTTSLHSEQGYPWFAAGFSDGFIRLFDRRMSTEIVREWNQGNACVLMSNLVNPSNSTSQIISGLDTGEVFLHDLRRAPAIPFEVNVPENFKALSMVYHPISKIYAVGSLNHHIMLSHTIMKNRTNTIRQYSGFISQRLGAVHCLTFHPSMLLLGVCTTDNMVSVHSAMKR